MRSRWSVSVAGGLLEERGEEQVEEFNEAEQTRESQIESTDCP